MGVTERLYYQDAYLTSFEAAVVESADDGRRVYLDCTAFYPASGGQPFDTGELGGQRVVDVIDEGERIAHVLAAPIAMRTVHGAIDWARRFDHMQQHTGQHLLSAIFAEKFGFETLSVHLGAEVSTIDLAAPALDPTTIEQAERMANEEIVRNRAVRVSFEDAATATGLRKQSGRSGELRVITIDGLDRSACGGTHVHATGEIGSLLIRGTEKIRQSTRLEFVCGLRAVAAARADSRAVKEQAASFQERIAQLEKDRRKLTNDLATCHGRDLYRTTEPGTDGLRRAVKRVDEIDESVRAEAQAFTQSGKALYLAATPESILLAVSADSGINAGATIKRMAARGGGSATIAQGSFANVEDAVDKLYRL